MKVHPAGIAALAILTVVGGVETISDPKMYADHGWAFYVFGADTILLAIILARAALQGRTNKAVQHQLDTALTEREELSNKVSKLEGVAKERGGRLRFLITLMNVMRERTIILRDCDEDHEDRLTKLEDRFRLAHDQAVARVALRGPAFDESGLELPIPHEPEHREE